MKKGRKPIKGNGIGIIAPIFFIFIMFYISINQFMHIPGKPFHFPTFWEIFIACLLGAIFGLIMLTQTSYEIREDGLIYSKPNKNFKYVIITIILIRIALSQYFKNLDSSELTTLTMTLALFYLCIWRIGSYVKFRKLHSSRQISKV